MADKIQMRRDQYAVWSGVNPTLAIGELAYDTSKYRMKIGEGLAWSATTKYATLDPRQHVKAWVIFDGGANPIVVNDGFNVSSITDNGTGKYRVNFTLAMSNLLYCVVATSTSASASVSNWTTTYVDILNNNHSGDARDSNHVSVVVFGTQAYA